jgi:hypothetical protein
VPADDQLLPGAGGGHIQQAVLLGVGLLLINQVRHAISQRGRIEAIRFEGKAGLSQERGFGVVGTLV